MELKSGYKQTEMGLIPEDWEVTPVENSFDVCNHLRLPISQTVREQMTGPYPYYGPTNVQDWINEYRVEGEYALIGEDGDHFLKWRTQPMTLLVRGKFNVNNHAHLVRGSKNLTKWFYWFFANRDLTPYLTRQGAGRYKLTKAALLRIPCAIPPLPEQRAIAEALSDVNGLLGGLDRLISKKRDLKQAAMQQLLTGQTRFPGEWETKAGYRQTDVGMIPEDWEVMSFKEQFNISAGGDVNLNLSSPEQDEVHRYPIYSNALTGKGLYGYCSYADHPPHSITITARGTLGVATYRDHKYTAIGRVLVLEAKRKTAGLFFAEFINSRVKFAIESTGVPQLTAPQISNYRLAVPPYYEQRAVAKALSDMDAELAALEQRREKTRALKQAMMQELLTGKTRLVAAGDSHARTTSP